MCRCRSIAVPISSAVFNRAFRTGLVTLDVPFSAKLAAIQNITMVAQNVPPEYLDAIIDLLAAGVRTSFIFGLSCAAGSVVTTLLIPWKPLQIPGVPMGRGAPNLPLGKKRPSKSQEG